MLDKKRIIIVSVIILLIVTLIIGVYSFFNSNREIQIIEYTPQEEISEQQLRQTKVTLYFQNGDKLVPEIRMIDVKELVTNPYEKILTLLIEGPKNENLIKTIAEGTKINKLQKEGDILIIDFSDEFIQNHPGSEETEKLTIKSIVNSLTELTEINGIKILINGEENKSFNDKQVNLEKVFKRENFENI